MKKMSIVERLDLLLSLRTEDMDLEHDRKYMDKIQETRSI